MEVEDNRRCAGRSRPPRRESRTSMVVRIPLPVASRLAGGAVLRISQSASMVFCENLFDLHELVRFQRHQSVCAALDTAIQRTEATEYFPVPRRPPLLLGVIAHRQSQLFSTGLTDWRFLLALTFVPASAFSCRATRRRSRTC